MSRQIISKNGGLARQLDLWLLIFSDMFPEGSKIPIEDLIIIGMGLKWPEDVKDITMRNRVLVMIETIRDHYGNVLRLVRDEYDNQCIEMGVGTSYLRELAALRNRVYQVTFVHDIIMRDWIDTTRYEHCLGLSLVLKRNRVNQLLVNLNCPKLSVFLLKYREESIILPLDFFQGMKKLTVLSLEVPLFPYSLDKLKNLRTLHVKVLKSIDMSVIGGLVNLEFLIVSTSSSTGIPRVIGQLENLKFLDLRNMNIAYISRGVFVRMLKLEELYLPLSFRRWGCSEKEEIEDHNDWESGGEDNDDYDEEDGTNASLSEIFALSLKALRICIPSASLFPKESPTYNICQFKILGPNNLLHRPLENCSLNILQLTGDLCDVIGSGICNIMSRTEHLSLTRVKDLKNFVHQLKHYHFRWLKEMIISECDELEYIFDVREEYTSFSVLEVLESLHLSMLSNLKEIWRGAYIGGFQNLRQVHIRFCHKLEYVFPMSMAGQLRNLKSIEILDCDELEGIFKFGVDDYPNKFYSLEELYLHSLPKLVSFLVKDYTKDAVHDSTHQSLAINKDVSNSTNLEEHISRFDMSCRPTSRSQWKNKLLQYTQKVVQNKQVSFTKNKDVLSHLETYGVFLPVLLLQRRVGNLKKLKISFCDSLRVIFSCKGKRRGKGIDRFERILYYLVELELFGLRNLVHVWFQFPSKTIAFQNLKLLVLVDCHNMYLFAPLIANLLVQLEKLQISRCEMMEEIVSNENHKTVELIVFQRLRALEFQHMPKLRFFYGGSYTIEFPLLKTLQLNQCHEMETFSHGSLHTPMLERVQLNGSIRSTGRDINATLKRWKENNQ